jgi:hypothetical protein
MRGKNIESRVFGTGSPLSPRGPRGSSWKSSLRDRARTRIPLPQFAGKGKPSPSNPVHGRAKSCPRLSQTGILRHFLSPLGLSARVFPSGAAAGTGVRQGRWSRLSRIYLCDAASAPFRCLVDASSASLRHQHAFPGLKPGAVSPLTGHFHSADAVSGTGGACGTCCYPTGTPPDILEPGGEAIVCAVSGHRLRTSTLKHRPRLAGVAGHPVYPKAERDDYRMGSRGWG